MKLARTCQFSSAAVDWKTDPQVDFRRWFLLAVVFAVVGATIAHINLSTAALDQKLSMACLFLYWTAAIGCEGLWAKKASLGVAFTDPSSLCM
jgi:hypothetical protein